MVVPRADGGGGVRLGWGGDVHVAHVFLELGLLRGRVGVFVRGRWAAGFVGGWAAWNLGFRGCSCAAGGLWCEIVSGVCGLVGFVGEGLFLAAVGVLGEKRDGDGHKGADGAAAVARVAVAIPVAAVAAAGAVYEMSTWMSVELMW